jgi:predicted RNase H-like nuclease (RuvC/YqgF family)
MVNTIEILTERNKELLTKIEELKEKEKDLEQRYFELECINNIKEANARYHFDLAYDKGKENEKLQKELKEKEVEIEKLKSKQKELEARIEELEERVDIEVEMNLKALDKSQE